MATARLTLAQPSRWELAAEAITVKIRWFGLVVGYLFVNLETRRTDDLLALNAILGLGVLYALVDTYYSLRGRVFLARSPLFISIMEAAFIGLLCHYDRGLDSPFRYYYLLSLIIAAIRTSSAVTYATCVLHCLSYGILYAALPGEQRDLRTLVLNLIIMGWVTWAADALSLLLKQARDHLRRLNDALQEHQAQLEERIAERTRELQEAQAHLLHQEKMAAFGLLAAGIAHEVGNPLTSISALVQLAQRRSDDPYMQEKLALVSGQLQRIQTTLRELTNFSRPAATEKTRTTVEAIVQEALDIAKYYKGMRGRSLQVTLPPALPDVFVVKDQLVQAVLNLVLNAIDATDKGGRIEVRARTEGKELLLEVQDDGHGIAPAAAEKLFQPYFTTKPHGTGLGLFVTKKLVTEHGGKVTFESSPGERTVFRVVLPVQRDEPGSQAPPGNPFPEALPRAHR